ncbi:hypothetical protein HN789_01845 [archaeon]|jgi:hypothetical protein|nr:hypothetical protein [archaeon]MBT4022557.1 hypothetical protein [archaeon]MBT4272883.1 hypothetical protein [archaeon]MBT4461683.1 hypothetical protein [archaeon]MBT4857549.1 hypothetical protein [archaeon]
METKYLVIGVVVAFIGLITLMFLSVKPAKGVDYTEFAQCLNEEGAVMYGAWWCGHCNDQKSEFGSSWKSFEANGGYIECSTQTRKQTQPCKDAGIKSYPTWRFADGTEQSGKLSYEYLSQKTGCSLP